MRLRDDESGQSLTELAIMLPLFVLMIMAALVFTDVVHDRLRAHEIARYTAFATTHMALRDYSETVDVVVPIFGSLGGRMSTAGNAVRMHATRLYPSNRTSPMMVGARGATLVSLSAEPFQYVAGNTVAEIAKQFGASAGAVTTLLDIANVINWVNSFLLDIMGVSGAPVFTSRVSVPLSFRLPWEWFGLASPNALTDVNIVEQVSVLADAWTLNDGRDVYPGGYVGTPKTGGRAPVISAMEKQVDRFYLLGGISKSVPLIGQLVSAFTEVAGVANGLLSDDADLGGPKKARVSMRNYGLVPGDGSVDVFEASGQERTWRDEIKTFDSSHVRDNIDDPDHSRQVRGLRQRGPYFKGCPHSQDSVCRDGR